MHKYPPPLRLFAAITWLGGGFSLFVKGGRLLFQAQGLEPEGSATLAALVAGGLIGLVKAQWLFIPACRRNLERIDQLPHPRPWQFFRPTFFLALALMISAGALFSHLSQGNYRALVGVAALDLSVATGLLISSSCFLTHPAFNGLDVKPTSTPARVVSLLLTGLLFCLISVHLFGLPSTGRLSPFVSDGCSSFPDGPPQQPERWRSCCLDHDLAYWRGGSYIEREQADAQLRACIAEVENQLLADTMWSGVRVGGSPLWPSDFRWGYGWPYGRGYRPLSPEERDIVQQLSPPVDR